MSERNSKPLIALAGSPNCGKTALFNALTGSKQKVANYPGVTVERKEGRIRTANGDDLRILDLPGAYSLNPRSPDEQISRDVLLGKLGQESQPEALVAVVDATNLERTLGLVLELKQLGRPVVVALNMMDLAQKRGLQLDLEILQARLGVPVIPTVATKSQGLEKLLEAVEEALNEKTSEGTPDVSSLSRNEQIQERFNEVDRILQSSTKSKTGPAIWTDRIDKIVLHPVYGSVVLFFVMALMFQAVFTWAGPLQEGVEWTIGWIGAIVSGLIPEGALQSLLVDGVIEGVGAVLVFLPQILLLFLFILLLEDLGYMARAAFLMDRLMGGMGLHGRAFIPLLSSFACAIPGVMAARSIQNPRDRLATILVAPLMTCAARLPVYTLLIGAFIPNDPILGGFFGLQGAVMLGLYVGGIVFALLAAFIFKKSFLKGPTPPLLLELPTYKLPSLRNLLFGLADRARLFIRRAGTVILSLTILLWFLASYPGAPEGSEQPPIYHSYAGKIGRAIEPALAPLGFDWRVSISLIPGFAAREVMVGALATVYAIEESDDEAALESELGSRILADWSLATALSLLVWYIFAPQCLSTIAVVRRETNSWKWAGFMTAYMLALAYVFSLITYQFFSRFLA